MINLNSILTDLGVLLEISASIHAVSLQKEIEELSGKLEGGRFYLVVIGLFKRGKSSLINALLGQELAPVAVTPLTSAITFFEYDAQTSARIYLNDERNFPVAINEIAGYIAEEYNPGNKKNVRYLKVFCNNPILKKMIIVDTPGLGSLFDHNTNTTMDFLPRIDAALFVLGADLPVSKADVEFLTEVNNMIPKVLFVLNKSDLLASEDLEKITDYNRKMLKTVYGNGNKDIEIIPVSVRDYFIKRDASDNRNPDPGNIRLLNDKIEQSIVVSRDEILVHKGATRLYALADELSALLKVKSDTLQMPLNELEYKRKAMQSSIDFLMAGKEDFTAVINNRIKQLQDKITETAENKRKELLALCNKLLVDQADDSWDQIKASDADTFSDQLYKQVLQGYEALKSNLEESVKEEFSQIIVQYSRQSQSFLNQLVIRMKELLGINIEDIISAFDLNVYTSFYMKSDLKYTIPSFHKKAVYRIIPDWLLKRLIMKQILTNCQELINPNAGRIRSDIDYKVVESFRKFKYQFDQKLYELLNNLKSIIEESIRSKSTLQENVDGMLGEISGYREMVEKIKDSMEVNKTKNEYR